MKRDPQRDDPPTRIIRHEFSLRSIFSLIAIAVGLWLLVQTWQIILLLVIALILAGTLSPILSWLEQHYIPRTVALGLILVVLVVGIVSSGALVIPALVTQVGTLVTGAPSFQGQVADYLANIPVLASSAEAVRSFKPQQLLTLVATPALSFAGAAATGIILGLTTVVLAFYLIADPQRVKAYFFALMPRRFHLRTARILLEMEAVVGGYMRGQALTSLLIGIFVFVVLWFVGTPAPLALAVFAAFADLIPFVGGVLVLVPAVLATLTVGFVPTLSVAVAIIIYMQVEGHILVPRVYGQTLRLSPLAVLVALLIGGQLLGIIGALLALPIAASLRVLIEQLRIDLPGEQPGEDMQRTLDAEAEVIYAEQTEGVSALEAVVVATSMAEDALEEEQLASGRIEVTIEEQSDATVPRV
jgi:predicted PurR-regulated permease PerM